jgi:two-component system chemotaxis response regulator CheB
LKKIRVLVVDDSLFLRRNLPRILETDPEIEVVGTAENGAEGLQKVKDLRPDVVTLDLMMPVMDGLTALKHIMREAPTPVVIVSATSREGARVTLEALALGAVDFVTKPSGPVSLDIHTVRAELVEKIRTAYASKIKTAAGVDVTRDRFRTIVKELSHERPKLVTAPLGEPGVVGGGKRLIAIAASTGGPMALQHLLTRLPADLNAGLVIVLHIASGFSRPLADRLNDLSQITVREAKDRAPITPGVALISPAGMHLTVVRPSTTLRRGSGQGSGHRTNAGLVARLRSEPSNMLHRPSANVLFHSIANCCAAETCAVILTGMGDDGALGLRAIHEGGGYTVAQDEATSVVYGMPRKAVELGGVDISLPLDRIAAEIVRATADVKRGGGV